MKMKNILITSVLVFSLISCLNKHKNDVILNNDQNINKENFDIFFKRFNNDSVFQISRIIFPLNNEIYDFESDKFFKEKIKQENWKYFNFATLSKKYITTLDKIKEDEVKLNIQIVDTGVNIDYFFTFKSNKWVRVKIVDQST
jgi:hypothetical protein